MLGVEVPVREVITHPGNLTPGDLWRLSEEFRVDGLDRFADLYQSRPARVEDKLVVDRAARQVPRVRCRSIALIAASISARRRSSSRRLTAGQRR
jgi:hypothetical protein